MTAPAQQANGGQLRRGEFLLPLRQQIEAACGGMGRNVEIIARSPTDLEVRVQVQNKTEGSLLAKRILAMPELAPYRVILAITWQ